MEPECRKKYELSEFKKANLLKVILLIPNLQNHENAKIIISFRYIIYLHSFIFAKR